MLHLFVLHLEVLISVTLRRLNLRTTYWLRQLNLRTTYTDLEGLICVTRKCHSPVIHDCRCSIQKDFQHYVTLKHSIRLRIISPVRSVHNTPQTTHAHTKRPLYYLQPMITSHCFSLVAIYNYEHVIPFIHIGCPVSAVVGTRVFLPRRPGFNPRSRKHVSLVGGHHTEQVGFPRTPASHTTKDHTNVDIFQ